MPLSQKLIQFSSEVSRDDWTSQQSNLVAFLQAEYAATYTVFVGENCDGPFAEVACKLKERNVLVVISPHDVRVESYQRRGLWPFRKTHPVSDQLYRSKFASDTEFGEKVHKLVIERARCAERISPDENALRERDKKGTTLVKVVVHLKYDQDTISLISADVAKRSVTDRNIWLANADSPDGFIGLVGEFANDHDLKWMDEGIQFEIDGINFYYKTSNPSSFIECVSGSPLEYPQEGLVHIKCKSKPSVFSKEVQRKIDEAKSRGRHT